ncbi:MAG: PstS family phosphate ABC transporter substrate-binding protein [Steroidobacteraceae bacterium]
MLALAAPVCAWAGAGVGGAATVEWQLPPAPAHAVQTHAEDLAGMRYGRPLPRPEVLQPTLDPQLKRFTPRYPRTLSGTLRVMCSDTMPILVRAWIRSFARDYPDVHVVFGPPFEGSDAATALRNGRIDIAFVSRELKPTDVTSFRARYGYPPTSVPVSGGSWRHFGYLDAVAVIANPSNPVKRLTLTQLDAIFSRSHLRGDRAATTWGDVGVRGAWAHRPIHVYGIKPWNGFEEFVRERVLNQGALRGHWRSGMRFSRTVFPVASRVAADPDGIGYTGLAFIDAGVKILSLGRGSAAVSPTYTNVALARYPLSRVIYANVNLRPRAQLPAVVAEFLRLILSRAGQRDVRQEGVFLPLRAFQVHAALHQAGLAGGS